MKKLFVFMLVVLTVSIAFASPYEYAVTAGGVTKIESSMYTTQMSQGFPLGSFVPKGALPNYVQIKLSGSAIQLADSTPSILSSSVKYDTCTIVPVAEIFGGAVSGIAGSYQRVTANSELNIVPGYLWAGTFVPLDSCLWFQATAGTDANPVPIVGTSTGATSLKGNLIYGLAASDTSNGRGTRIAIVPVPFTHVAIVGSKSAGATAVVRVTLSPIRPMQNNVNSEFIPRR